MLKTLIFWSCVLFLNTAIAASSCSSLLENSNTLTSSKAFSARRTSPQTWDVAEHGMVIDRKNQTDLNLALKTLSERDGTYPLIIDKDLNLVIDHRLPESSFADLTAKAFVGNHLGLYNQLKTFLNKNPQVVFAGQIRVVGGKVRNLIDQSGSFYFNPKDLGFTSDDKVEKLIAINQERLNEASFFLKDLNILNKDTEVINFLDRFKNYPDSASRNEGHVDAKKAARFERFCRGDSACWAKHQKIEKALRVLFKKHHSKEGIVSHLMNTRSGDPIKDFEIIQVWSLILNEGVTDLLSKEGAIDPQTEQGAVIKNFIESLN